MPNPPANLKTKPNTGEETGSQGAAVGLSTWVELPGLKDAPPGTYETYRAMLMDPTIALARAVVMAPLIGNTWAIQSKDDTPEDRVTFIEDMLDPMISTIIENSLLSLDYGWAGFEKVFEVRDGKFTLKRLKPLLHDITQIDINNNGKFQGFKQAAINLPVEKSLLFTNDRYGDNHYGRSRLENARQTWSWWIQANDGAARYDKKIAGVMPVVHYPPGKSIDKHGNSVDNYEIAQRFLDSIASGHGIAIPNEFMKFAEADIPERRQWIVELMEDRGSRQPGFGDRLRYLDSLKFRGYLRPERSALEGQFGTKAEAETHGDLGLLDGEKKQKDIAQVVNWHVIDQLLVLNFGEDARGSIWYAPNPLQDASVQFARDLVKTMMSTPDGREEIRLYADLSQVVEVTKLPLLPEPIEVTPPDTNDEPADSILNELESRVAGTSSQNNQQVGDSGIATTAGLNGAQITAALNIIERLTAQTISTEQALALLLAMGVDEDKASRIIAKG